MKILLIGPYPPPHGGVSVHVYEARRQLLRAGIECHVVNVDPRALPSSEYVSIRGGLDLFLTVVRFSRQGWIPHVHTNGHNLKSWLVALIAGLAGITGCGSVLTLHSGMAPAYVARHRMLVRAVCALYSRIVAVSPEIRDALPASSGDVDLLPAFLLAEASHTELPELQQFDDREPRLAATLFFRPEYGFELLVEAVDRLRAKYPRIVCLVMGSGEDQEQAERLIEERGLAGQVVLLGNVAHEKCLAVMSHCDVVVRPALVDGDANCVREALSLGIPVVASDVGNRPEGVTLFHTGDAGDLTAKLAAAVAEPETQPLTATTGGGIQSLIDIYAARKAQWES